MTIPRLWMRVPFLVAIGLGCRRAPTPPTAAAAPAEVREDAGVTVRKEDLQRALATALADVFREFGVEATVTQEVTRAAGHRIRMRVQDVILRREPSRWVSAVPIQVEVDDAVEPAFESLATGFENSADEAIRHAGREWLVAIGRPLVQTLMASQGPGPAADGGVALRLFSVPGFRVVAGPTGLRGDGVPAGVSADQLVRGVLDRFQPRLGELVPPPTRRALHSLRMVLHVKNGVAGEGFCRLDGRPDPRVCDVARGFAFPMSADEYLFSQFFVLMPPP